MFSLDQYRAAHESAVVVDRSSQGKMAFAGADRASFLHALLTNDIARLTKGTGAYSAYLTPQGRMISDMRVIETGERMLLDVEGEVAGQLAERFDTLIFSEDVRVENVTADLAEIGVHGPTAAAAIERASGIAVARLEHQYDNLVESGITIVRDDAFGMTGFDMYVDRCHAEGLRRKLIEAGTNEIEDETAEVLRIEAGRPRFGVDMDTETIPLEAGIEERAISFTKGCYVGQEVIIRVLHRGHGRIARKLVGLIVAAGSTPSRGDAILAAGGQPVGEVTSAAFSPLVGAPIALGYVHRDHMSPGTELMVAPARPARVRALPFTP